jgi:hypothetical protein
MRTWRILGCVLVLVTLSGAKRRAIDVTPPRELTIERSFAVTDKSILAAFPLDRVLATLVANSVTPDLTPERFFRQMFDTQNPGPGLDASMPHCDDELLGGLPAQNGFRRRCPTAESFYATQPYNPSEFEPVGLINRFDMADAGGATCGQYRIIFERKNVEQLVNIIFEGGLRNPHPEQGLAACRDVAQFWAGLSSVDSIAERRARLEEFFLKGIPGFPPVVHPDHYRDAPNGIRTMHWPIVDPVRFYQFRVVNGCEGGACRLFARPDGLENMPSSRFLDATDTSDRATRFRAHFLEQIPNLVKPDVNAFFMTTPDEFLVAENESGDGIPHATMSNGFSRANRTPQGIAFWNQVQKKIHDAGSNLWAEDVMIRATSTNCGGCHVAFETAVLGDGLFFPRSTPLFQQVSRTVFEKGDEGPASRFAISPAMREVFIPNRMRILTEFLKSGKAPERSK